MPGLPPGAGVTVTKMDADSASLRLQLLEDR